MILVVAYTPEARSTVQNVCRLHEATVVRTFGRAVLLRETEFGAFLACRLREKHETDVQVEQTTTFNEFSDVPSPVRKAAARYEARETPSTPYPKFAAGRELPMPAEMQGSEL